MEIHGGDLPLTLHCRDGRTLSFSKLDNADIERLEPFSRPLELSRYQGVSFSSYNVPRLAAIAKHVRGAQLRQDAEKSTFSIRSLLSGEDDGRICHYVHVLSDWRGCLDHRFYRVESAVIPRNKRWHIDSATTPYEQTAVVEIGKGFERYMAAAADVLGWQKEIAPFLCSLSLNLITYGFDGERYFVHEFDDADEYRDWLAARRELSDEELHQRKDEVLQRHHEAISEDMHRADSKPEVSL